MKVKPLILTTLLLLAFFQADAEGQNPSKSWQWLEHNNRVPFTKPPEPYKVSNIDNLPAYLRSMLYMFEDDLMAKFYKDGGKKVAAVKKRDYDRYYITKYGQDFEMVTNLDKVWHPTIQNKSDQALAAVTFLSKVPMQDTSKIIDLVYEFLNDMYNLKGVFYNMTISNGITDPREKIAPQYGVSGNWYGLQCGALVLNTAPDGKMSNSMLQFRPALNRGLSHPNFRMTITIYEFDYLYSFEVDYDKAGKFFDITYQAECIYFHTLAPGDRWEPTEQARREEYKLLLNVENDIKKAYAMARLKPVPMPIAKLLKR